MPQWWDWQPACPFFSCQKKEVVPVKTLEQDPVIEINFTETSFHFLQNRKERDSAVRFFLESTFSSDQEITVQESLNKLILKHGVILGTLLGTISTAKILGFDFSFPEKPSPGDIVELDPDKEHKFVYWVDLSLDHKTYYKVEILEFSYGQNNGRLKTKILEGVFLEYLH